MLIFSIRGAIHNIFCILAKGLYFNNNLVYNFWVTKNIHGWKNLFSVKDQGCSFA